MLDENFIKRKLKLMAEDMKNLEELRNYSLDDLAKDFYKLNAAERLLEKIVIRASDINSHLISELGKGIEKVRGYYDSFIVLAELRVYPAEFSKRVADDVKFRNILIHEYNNIDKNLIHKKIKEVLDDFNQYSNYILEFIEKQK